jgi:hypothetical protein
MGWKSAALWAALKVSAKGGLPRFMMETFVTPSLYPRIFSDTRWRNFVLDAVIKSKYEPRPLLEVLERNVRFRTAARRKYMQESFKLSPIFKARYLEGEDAPTRSTVISGGFPEVSKFQYWGDEDSRRRELTKQLKDAKTGSDLSHWTPEDVLEACGCYIYGTSPFNAFCEEEGVYDLFTQEYVEALAQHLKGRKLVLEVGAGSGRLAHLLRRRLGSTTEVVATDSGGWSRMKGHRPTYPVAKCDYNTALSIYEPDVVITSWMPMNQDWTTAFRQKPSVEEYILIGNPESCGKSWESWGMRRANAFDTTITSLVEKPVPDTWPLDLFEWLSGSTGQLEPDAGEEEEAKIDKLTPFELDGFIKVELGSLSRMQLSRYDRIVRSGNSRTVSFIKGESKPSNL